MNRKQRSLLTAAAFALAADGAFAAHATKIEQSPLDDAHLTTQVRVVLARQTATAELPISVTTTDGVVSLTGPVGTINQMARAVVGAAGIDGVVRVKNHLRMRL